MRIKSIFTHSAQAIAEGALISLLVVGLIAGTAFAAKPAAGTGGHKGGGGGGGSSSLSLVLVKDINGNGAANWNDTITFNVSTTATAYPTVSLRCYQNGTLVYAADAGFYPSFPWPGAQIMPLYSDTWTAGAANCTATLNTNLATLSFLVGA